MTGKESREEGEEEVTNDSGHNWLTRDEKAGTVAREFERICGNCGACYEQAKDLRCPNPQAEPKQIGEIDFKKQTIK